MKLKNIIIIVIILLLVGGGAGGYFYYKRLEESRPKQYETTAVTRGTVEKIIVSTGTLDPVGSVEVGTQVSGTIEKVLVDFNDTVRAGQIIAELDRVVLASRLTEAQASFSRTQALFTQSEQEFKRGELLFEKGLISEQEFLRHRTDYQTQKASVQVAKAAVNTAAENLRYTTIRSPVRGTVISRNVDVGQTVAASLSAPTLFVIAEDLKKMKIMAQVDETDIGRIRPGLSVRFTVQAYPDRNYSGEVSQVRLQPEIVQNVVTYTVVILADNNDGTLLPGMTANVEFVEAKEENALVVPMSVFRFQPPADVLKKFEDEKKAEGIVEAGKEGAADLKKIKKRVEDAGGIEGIREKAAEGKIRGQGGGQGMTDGSRQRQGGGGLGGQGQRRQTAVLGSKGVLWTLDENNEFKPVYVRMGINDGVRAAVTSKNENLQEGLKVVTGEVRNDRKKSNTPNRSLIPQQGRGGNTPRRM